MWIASPLYLTHTHNNRKQHQLNLYTRNCVFGDMAHTAICGVVAGARYVCHKFMFLSLSRRARKMVRSASRPTNAFVRRRRPIFKCFIACVVACTVSVVVWIFYGVCCWLVVGIWHCHLGDNWSNSSGLRVFVLRKMEKGFTHAIWSEIYTYEGCVRAKNVMFQ